MHLKICLVGEGLDIIRKHSHSGVLTSHKNYSLILKKAGATITFDPRDDYDVLHIFQPLGIQSYFLALEAKEREKKVVISAHTTKEDFDQSFHFSHELRHVVGWWLKKIYSAADLIIAPSAYTKAVLERYGLKNPIRVISNGIDLDAFSFSAQKRKTFRKKWRISRPVVLSVGHIFKRKGIRDFVSISRRVPTVDFFWFGTIYPTYLVDAGDIRSDPSFNLHFVGKYSNIIEAYCGSDYFLFPSYNENEGIVVLEAAAMGVPIIVRDIPVYEGWMVHGKNCLKAKTLEEFVYALHRLQKSKSLRKKLIQNAKKMVRERSLEKIAVKVKSAYESL